MRTPFGILLRILGFGALVAGGLVVAAMVLFTVVLLGPLVFWFAWNVLNFAHAVGLPELGFWGILLATAFLVVGWPGKVLLGAVVFIADPSWFHHGSAQVHWPTATLKNFIAFALLAALASRPHSHAHKHRPRRSL
jgi:hypothetical protein